MYCDLRQALLLVLIQTIPGVIPQTTEELTYVSINPADGIVGLQGFTQNLRCEASYQGEPVDVAWYYNDAIIETQPRFTIDYDTNRLDTYTFSFLTIISSEVTDSGRYSCMMKYQEGRSASVLVRILESPVIVSSPAQTLTPNQTTSLFCRTEPPDLTNQGGKMFWHKDGRFIGIRGNLDINGDEIPDVTILPNGTLTILPSATYFAGVYNCRVRYRILGRTHYVSSDIYVNANVTILMEDFFWYNEYSRYPLQLRCFAKGFPHADVQWSHEGAPVRGGDKAGSNVTIQTTQWNHVTVMSVLSIRELPGSFNSSRYTCSGQNMLGADQKTSAVVNLDEMFSPNGGDSVAAKRSAISLCLLSLLAILAPRIVTQAVSRPGTPTL